MHGAQNTGLNACTLSAKNCICTRACAHMQLCRSFFAMQLLQTYLESCASIVQAVVAARPLVTWCGGLFLTEGKIGVLSVFNAGGSVCGCMCVYTHTHAHTAQMEYSDVSPGVGMRHLEGLKNPDGLNLGIYIFVYVYKVHMCMYMLGGGMRSWTNCFFL